LGWIAGGFLGSWAPRTVGAVGATAIALGLLNRQPRATLLGAVSTAMVSLAAVHVGQSFFSPLLAWPVAGLVIGTVGAFAFRRRRTRIAFIIAAPLLGSVGVAAGMLAVFLTARELNDSRVAAQIMLGGAAGFGLLVMAGAALVGRWLDGSRAAGGAS
jgi:FtsH-binding integral membrane protein